MAERRSATNCGIALAALAVLAALPGCGDPKAGGNGGLTQREVLLLQRQLDQIASQANQNAPATIDPNTRLDAVKAGPGLKLTSTYTLLNTEANGISAATFGAKLTPVIKEASCANPELRQLIDQGVVVVLEYRGTDGKPIGTMSVNRATCIAPGAAPS